MNLKTVTDMVETVLDYNDDNSSLDLVARRYVIFDNTLKTGTFAKTQLAFKDKDGGAFVVDIKHYRDEATFPPAYDEIPETA